MDGFLKLRIKYKLFLKQTGTDNLSAPSAHTAEISYFGILLKKMILARKMDVRITLLQSSHVDPPIAGKKVNIHY